MRQRPFLFLIFFLASIGYAQIIVPTPKAGEPFELRVDTVLPGCSAPTNPRLFVAGKNIFLTFTWTGGCGLPAFTVWQTTIAVPGLGAGTYHLQVRIIGGGAAYVFFETEITVIGPPPGIEISPTFDANAGNRVVKIRGTFPCGPVTCAAPVVLFGNKPAEGVDRMSENELHAVVPFQTNVRVVDVTVRGDNYTYVLPSGFTYVGADYEPVLFPVYTRQPAPGAFGSLWQTEFRALNLAQIPLVPGIDVLLADSDFPPAQIKSPTLTTPRQDVDTPPTAMAYVRRELAPFISFQLRVRDLSRQSETWGTEIPVIRDFQYKHDMNLLDVPIREGFRSLLRIYSPVYGGCCGVMMTFRTVDGKALATRVFQLQHPNGSIGGL
ncbi:MAG TPA: hypothetical protein VGK04_02935, partial [Thermoanaerobaculia bacterium]